MGWGGYKIRGGVGGGIKSPFGVGGGIDFGFFSIFLDRYAKNKCGGWSSGSVNLTVENR